MLKPISRDQILVSFGWKYFVHVVVIMVSCTAIIAGALSLNWLESIDTSNDFMRAIQFSLKMKEAKDGDLNIVSFIFIH